MSEEEELLKEAKKLPWEGRLFHKSWKVRDDANVDLASLCASISDPKDPRIRELGPFFKKTVADSNAPVQEKALDALIAYLRAADADAGRFGKEVCDAIVAKCLTGRPKTVEKAQMAFMLWVELEAVDAFLDAMEKAIKNKVAKAVVPAIDAMFQALSQFGAKIVLPKRILKMLPELFDHQDQNVRTSSKGLTLELCRWIGKDPVKSILFEKMRDTMKKEVEAELVNVSGTAKPSRKIRSEQDKQLEQEAVSEVACPGPSEESETDAPQGIDEYELVDPVNILIPLEKSGFWEGVKATKWSERKEAVAELTKLASTRRISPGDFLEVCRTLKKLITDVNIAVAVEAIQAIGNLARGLRTNFSASSRFLLPVLLEKLKEKKPTLTESLTQTLQAMHKAGCISLVDIVEDVRIATKNKVPLVRSLTLTWVTFCIEDSNESVITKVHKDYVSICMECLNDGTPDVRDAAFSALAAIAKSVGMRPLERSLEKLDDVRRMKLSEMIAGVVPGGSAAAPVQSTRASASSTEASESGFVKKSAASMLSRKRPIEAAPAIKKGSTTKSETNKKADGVEKIVEDIHGPAVTLVPEELKPYGDFQESFESARAVSVGATSKGFPKVGKSTANGVAKHANRVVSSRAMATRGTKSESISIQDITVQSQALLNIKDSNKVDRERMVVRRFKFEVPRIEQIQGLENDMMKYFREDLHRRLLSADFKKQIDGIEMLQKALPSIAKEIIEVLDILLKWFVLQFCKSNTTCLLKVLDFLPELLHSLEDEGYSLTESEVALFLPCLVEKLGHNIEKVRERMRELTKQFVLIYSTSKCFPYILEGLRSKNNRTRIECADLVGFIIDNHGAEISGQLKSLQIVASLTSERDGETRKAALNTLATGYKFLGEDIWRFVGKLTDAQKSMIDERFKWKVREMEKKKEGKPGEARAILRQSVRENGRNHGQPDLNIERQSMSHPLAVSSGPTNWNDALDIISVGSPEQSVEGMKIVCHELAQASSDPEGSAMDELVKYSDRLVSCLTNQVARTFDFSLTGASSRACKYVLNTLMQTFQNKRLAHAVKESTLDSLSTELLLWLLDDRVPHMDGGSQLLKALNVLMLKILDSADRTSSFVVLINLLRPLDPSRWPLPASNESFASRNQKFSDLVVKCLIKLTKDLQSTIYYVDLDQILQSIHLYLQDLGMEEIRRRAGTDDKPLRMVKTILHELVKICGAEIKGHLSMVPIDSKPQPIILAYIELNIETLAAARMLTASGPGEQNHWGYSATNNSPFGTHYADAQLKQELAAIFKKIGEKQTCMIGLNELYRITQLYPEVDIFSQLQNASEAFRSYIRDGLSQMEKIATAGRTPPRFPMSTPPPASSNRSSPDFAPLSPLNANPLGNANKLNVKPEPTNFYSSPSYNEKNRIYQ